MSIAALPRVLGGGEGEKAGLNSRIGCNVAVVARGVAGDNASDTTSSSIGKASESISAVESTSQCQEDSDEVQSSYKGPLFVLNALEESLPIRYYFSFLCGWFFHLILL
jgi:hypothetical protein